MKPLAKPYSFLLALLSAGSAARACTLSFTSLSFGTYAGAAITGVNQATENCTNGTKYTIGLNAGTGSGATTTTRVMTGPNGATLKYQIFQNSSRTTNWGNTTGADTVAGTGTGSNQTISAFSEILAGQLVQPGSYSDTISFGSATFNVTATVQATCSISASALSFGVYTGSALSASSGLSVACTSTTTYTIGLSAGTTTGATDSNRLMIGPVSSTLSYSLHSDAAQTSNWGATTGTVSGTGNGATQAIPVYGRVAGNQYKNPGNYTDTITATLTY